MVMRSLHFLGKVLVTLTLIGVTQPEFVRAQSAGSGTIITVAGIGNSGLPGDGVPATNAALSAPIGLSVSGNGGLCIYEDLTALGNPDGRFRFVSPTNGFIFTLAHVMSNPGIAIDRA